LPFCFGILVIFIGNNAEICRILVYFGAGMCREKREGSPGEMRVGLGGPASARGDPSISQIVSGEFSRAGCREDAGAAQKPTSSGVGWLEVTLGQPGRRDRCAETFRAGSAATKPG
jgi:hypothetical protein